jgi:hypothetical protein
MPRGRLCLRLNLGEQRRDKDDASAAELRAELMKRIEILVSAGLIADGGNSESADTRRQSIVDQRGVTFTRSF